MITATRYHDFSCGHRVHGHESKCAHLHGHNYRVHFTVAGDVGVTELDAIGRVLDFSVINDRLCQWLEVAWDHCFLIWAEDPWCEALVNLDPKGTMPVPFNPTAENMAHYLLTVVGPEVLPPAIRLIKVVVEETRKCSAAATPGGIP
jgi:6-pyruvoyltetrahydropterin/6-carboxytetrahydropterin synthase